MIFTPPKLSLINLDFGNLLANALGGNLTLRDLISDPRDISLLCMNASLPGRQITTFDTEARDASRKIPYGYLDTEVVATFLLTEDYYMKTIFDNWMEVVFDTSSYHANWKDDFVTDVRIQQLNKKGNPVYGVVLEAAYPTSITEIALDNTLTDAIGSFTVTFSYDKWRKESGLESAIGQIKSGIELITG
jgi:hypothetical protein